MFPLILTLLMILERSTPASEQKTSASMQRSWNEVPFGKSSLTETASKYDVPTDISSISPEGKNGDPNSLLDSNAPLSVTTSTSEAEGKVLKAADPAYERLISGMNIHHCHCPGGQALTLSGCTPFNTSVTIIDSTKYSPRTIPTSLLSGHVSKLNCGEGKVPMILPNGSFALLPGGALLIPSLGMFYGHDHYCVSHVDRRDSEIQTEKRDEQPNRQVLGAMNVSIDKKYVSWKAKVCIKQSISRCCDGTSHSYNGIMDSKNETKCYTQRNSLGGNDTNSFFSWSSNTLSPGRAESNRPVIMFGPNPVEWDYVQALPVHLNCPLGKYVVEQHMVKNRILHLSYSREGSMLTWDILENMHIDFRHDEFCLDRKRDEGSYKYFAKFCHYDRNEDSSEEIVQSPPYVRKCCSENTIYQVERQKCEASKNEQMWIENLYKDVQWDVLSKIHSNFDDYSTNSTVGAYGAPLIINEVNDSSHDPLEYEEPFINLARIPLMWGFPTCSWQDINVSAEDFKLLPDGSVLARGDTLDPSLFCFETFISSKGSPSSPVHTLVICDLGDPFGNACSWATSLLVPLMGVSCAFMVLTLLIFLTVPDLTDRVSSRCLVSEIVALLVSFVLLIVAHSSQSIYGTVYCVLLGTLSHAAALASFFWLNAICVEVWITIRRLNPEPRIQGHRRFVAYCCWGWGAPAVVALLGALADALPPTHGLLRPQTAVACFPNKDNRSAHWAYVYAPMAALLCVNLCLFVHLSVTIVRTTRQMARMRARAPSHETVHYWNKMKTYLKLFLVMGVSWSAEVFSFQFKSCGVWIFTDSFNALRGVFIFFIFVFKAEVLEKVRNNAKDRWSRITGRARQVLTAVRGRNFVHSRTNGKEAHVSGSSSGAFALSVQCPASTPRSHQPKGTPATTPTSFLSLPPEFPTVNPYTEHSANGLDPTQHNLFVVYDLSGLPSDQNTEIQQQEEGFVPNESVSFATTSTIPFPKRHQFTIGSGGSFHSSSSRVAPLSSAPSSGLVTMRSPLSALSPGISVTSKLWQARSSPSLHYLPVSGMEPWTSADRAKVSTHRALSVYSRHMNGDEL